MGVVVNGAMGEAMGILWKKTGAHWRVQLRKKVEIRKVDRGGLVQETVGGY